MNIFLKYFPLTPDGRFCSIDWYKAVKFSFNCTAVKSDLPKLICTTPALSALYSNLPFLKSD